MSESATTETAGSVLDSSPGVSGLPSSPLSRDHGGATIRARSSVFGVRVKAAVAVHWVAATTRQNDFACTKTRDRLGGIAGNTEQFVRQQGCKPRGRNAAVCLEWVLWLLVLE